MSEETDAAHNCGFPEYPGIRITGFEIIGDYSTDDDGVNAERVDPHTLQAIDQLFPSPCSGLQFLALLLRLATCKQIAMANMGVADVAEITIQSIRVLASKIGWSYETTHKYVVLFCSLGLLLKTRENGLVKLRFPLCRYEPPQSLHQLERLIAEARPKVVSCAKKVRRRFLLLYGKQLPPTPAPQLPQRASAGYAIPAITEAITDLHQIMDLPEASALRDRLAAILAKLEGNDQHTSEQKSTELAGKSPPNGGLAAQMVDSLPAGAPANGRLPAQMVDSLSEGVMQNGRLTIQTVDSPPDGAPANGRLPIQAVDSAETASQENGRLAGQESTISAAAEAQNGRLSAQTVDSTAKTVDSAKAAAPNVNVIINTMFERFNVNVREPIEYLRALFQEPESKRGYYYNLLKTCAQADIWLAATVETLLAMQRQADPVAQPGRYFYDRVIALSSSGLSAEARQLVAQYGGLSYVQLQAVLRAGPGSGPTIPGGATKRIPGARPQPREVKATSRIERDRARAGMSDEEWRLLQEEILHDLRFTSWISRPYRQTDGSCALLVETPGGKQIWLYQRANWQQGLAPLLLNTPAFTKKSPSRNDYQGGKC